MVEKSWEQKTSESCLCCSFIARLVGTGPDDLWFNFIEPSSDGNILRWNVMGLIATKRIKNWHNTNTTELSFVYLDRIWNGKYLETSY